MLKLFLRTCQLILLGLMLNISLGCTNSISIQVENYSSGPIMIVDVMRISLNGADEDSTVDLGTVSPGGIVKFDNATLDGDREFILHIKDSANRTVGEVRQSGRLVHQNMTNHTWTVKIPSDMTRMSTVQPAKPLAL